MHQVALGVHDSLTSEGEGVNGKAVQQSLAKGSSQCNLVRSVPWRCKVGVVRSSEGEFWLEPVEGGLTITEHTHMVFKRAATTTADPRKKRRKKRRRHEKNCGTREPRRVTELEWKETKGEKVKVQGRSKRRKGRWRRSTSVERHVEALLVADPSMMAFHQDRDVETYFLTIMNMVSLLYLDPSIGNPINVVVVRIVLLFEDDVGEKKLNVTVNADQTLESFCTWQLKMNTPDDNHPNHHDVAILVTRVKEKILGAEGGDRGQSPLAV
uniref:Uncharacterized protein n=1 Tax=Timema cristinae TaxID=61476 RepID=A0A7R9GU52_TIMCR|nr:unnamed protein product [Timema cristinae]